MYFPRSAEGVGAELGCICVAQTLNGLRGARAQPETFRPRPLSVPRWPGPARPGYRLYWLPRSRSPFRGRESARPPSPQRFPGSWRGRKWSLFSLPARPLFSLPRATTVSRTQGSPRLYPGERSRGGEGGAVRAGVAGLEPRPPAALIGDAGPAHALPPRPLARSLGALKLPVVEPPLCPVPLTNSAWPGARHLPVQRRKRQTRPGELRRRSPGLTQNVDGYFPSLALRDDTKRQKWVRQS